jgi:omega-6 fatty acid desaturase (delta-12 desaturase)
LSIVATATPLSRQFTSVPGFTQIAEPVPEGVLLSDVVKSLPKEVFEIDDVKAWKTVAITLGSVALGYAALAVSPWYLLPVVYAYLGTAMTGLFVVGHDCGHNSFSKSQLVNDVVGTIMFMPLMYPFEPWRIKHNTHHAHTNKLVIDTAWQPFRPYMYDRAKGFSKFAMEAAMGPLWWMASVGHWLFWHFDLTKYRPQDVPKVKVSLAAVAAFGAFALLPLLVMTGPIGFVKWWVLPWLGFHFWMSTFTLVHHTAPHIPFKQSREWNAAEAQLAGTVHCEYPRWVEYLCHDISVHIPHHISSRIPSYNLRKAYASLQQNWDKHLNKAEFGVPLMTTIVTQCNLFDDKKKKWVKFDKASRDPSTADSSPASN